MKNYPYIDWWSKVLNKMPYDAFKSIWCRKNLPATLWILFANPIIVPLYAILIALLMLLSADIINK